MPFCPICKTEYPPGAKRCVECEVDLVEKLPEEDSEEEIKWVLLYYTPNRVFAEFLKETLEQNSIPCVIRPTGSFLEQGLGYVEKDNPGFKAYVPEDKYKEALAIKNQTVGEL
jgi:hypothetical protein